MNVRLVVFTLLGLVVWQVSVGIWSFFSNLRSLPFDFHRYGAAAVLIIFVFKGRIIYRSLRAQLRYHRVRPRTYLSLFLLFELVAVLLLALLWFFNATPTFITGSTTPLDVHIWIALALVPVMFVHAVQRLYGPRMRAPLGRRQAIRLLALGAGAVALWQLTILGGALTNPPGTKRLTGSRTTGSCPTCLPSTVWFFDASPVVDASQWTLTVRGLVNRELVFTYASLPSSTLAITAPVDCTGGWFSTQDWQGFATRQLLDQSGLKAGAALVIFRSVTGHNAQLPIDEAMQTILATHVAGQPLAPEHGFPLRLIAPARRGFQWTKWLGVIEVV